MADGPRYHESKQPTRKQTDGPESAERRAVDGWSAGPVRAYSMSILYRRLFVVATLFPGRLPMPL